MKPITRNRRLSTIFNLETEPIYFSKDELVDLYAQRPTGLTEPLPLLNQSRIVDRTFQGWPLMIILAVLLLGVGVVVGFLSQQVFELYAARLRV